MKKYGFIITLSGLIAAMTLILSILFFVHGGDFYHSLWPGERYPVPVIATTTYHLTPLFKGDSPGWDGQFYYYASISPFWMSPDVNGGMDSPAYRSQRVGLPALAFITSAILGEPVTSPKVYFLVNIFAFLILSLILIFWFERTTPGSSILLLPWIGSVGVIATLAHGLPDALTSSAFALAVLCYLKKMRIPFALLATFCVLSREGTAIFFLGLVVGHCLINLRKKQLRLFDLAFLGAPLGALLAWDLHLKHIYGHLPSAESGSVMGSMFVGWWHALAHASDVASALFLLCFLSILVLASLLIVRQLRTARFDDRVPVYAGTAMYVLLLTSLGPAVFGFFRDYLKNCMDVMVLIPLICVFCRSSKTVLTSGIYGLVFIMLGLQCLADWKLYQFDNFQVGRAELSPVAIEKKALEFVQEGDSKDLQKLVRDFSICKNPAKLTGCDNLKKGIFIPSRSDQLYDLTDIERLVEKNLMNLKMALEKCSSSFECLAQTRNQFKNTWISNAQIQSAFQDALRN